MRLLFGIKNPQKVSEKDQRRIESKLNTEFIRDTIDTAVFNSLHKKMQNKPFEKLFYQPMQFYIYKKHELISFGANCLYPGKPLNWDFYHQFDSLKLFIPNSLDTSSVYRNEVYLKLHQPILNKSKTDTTLIVFYSSFLWKESKNYLKYVNKLNRLIRTKSVFMIPLDESFRNTMK